MDITKVEDIEKEIALIESTGKGDPENAHCIEDDLLREYVHYRAAQGDELATALEGLYHLEYPKWYA